MRWGSFALGFLGLTALDAVLSSNASAARAGGLLGVPGALLRRLVDPSLSLIPNYHDTHPAAGQDGIGGK